MSKEKPLTVLSRIVMPETDGKNYKRLVLTPDERMALYCKEYNVSSDEVWIESEDEGWIELGSENPAHDVMRLELIEFRPA